MYGKGKWECIAIAHIPKIWQHLSSFINTLSGGADCKLIQFLSPSDLSMNVYAQAISKKVYTGS